MKYPKIIVIVESGLMQAAFKQIIKNYQPVERLKFSISVEECLSSKINPQFLIIESKLIPYPLAYSLGKIRTKNADTHILLIETSQIDKAALCFVQETINRDDSEELVSEKIKKFFDKSVNNNPVTDDNLISGREKEIVRLVALGRTNKEISDALFISPHTVITHRKNITAKLGIKTIAGLTVYAILNGLIEPKELGRD